MKNAWLIRPFFAVLSIGVAHADDIFTVLPQQAVSIGEGVGDSFLVERISRSDNNVVVLLRPKGEDCPFRFVVGVGHSVQLRIDAPSGQSFFCRTTLRPIVDVKSVQFGAECVPQPTSYERKCPPESSTSAAASQ